MLSEEVIDKVVERLVNRVEQANEYVLKEIGGHIKRVRNVIPSRAYQLGQLIKYGGDYDKIVKKLSEITKISVKEIYEIFEEVAKNDYYFAKQFYRYRNKKFIPYMYNTALQNQVKAIAKMTADNFINISNTYGFTKKVNGNIVYTDLSKTYQETIDKAILNVSQGKATFDEMIKETLKELGESGLKTVDYASGRTKRLDSAVRMNLKEGLRTLHNETQRIFGEEFESDGVEISVHSAPAPDHEDIQGRQFSHEEFEKLQSGEEATDYKGITYEHYHNGRNRRPVSKLNCYHYTFAIVLGVSKPQYNDKQLKEIIEKNEKGFEFDGKHYTYYEGTQLQRKLELEIRKTKDVQIIAKASDNQELVYQSQEKIKSLTRKYKELSDVSGIPTKLERLRVDNYEKVNILKANKEVKRDIKKIVNKNEKDNINKYEDITDVMLNDKKVNTVEPRHVFEYTTIDKDNNPIVYNTSNAKFDIKGPDNDEIRTINTLREKLGWDIDIIHRINNPSGISVPDIMRNNTDYWDIKNFEKSKSDNAFRSKIYNAIRKKKNQSQNFVIDLNNDNCDLTNDEAIRQITRVYNDFEWVDKIVLIGKDEFIKVYKRK